MQDGGRDLSSTANARCFPAMNWIDRLERRAAWLSFPGLLRFYAILHAMVFVLQMLRPNIGQLLEFDRAAILSGEVWRVVTFLFASSGFSGIGPLGILFFFFMVMIAFMMSDALEGTWGVFRTTLYFYVGMLGLVAGNFLLPQAGGGSGFLLYQAAFFAFATLFPRVEFLLFFVLPVQVRVLAWILGGWMMLVAVGQFFSGFYLVVVFYALAFANYFFWAGLPALQGRAMAAQSAQRRRKFQAAKEESESAFHRCEECERTDSSDPQLEFRISADGKEYCIDHLPEEQEEKG